MGAGLGFGENLGVCRLNLVLYQFHIFLLLLPLLLTVCGAIMTTRQSKIVILHPSPPAGAAGRMSDCDGKQS